MSYENNNQWDQNSQNTNDPNSFGAGGNRRGDNTFTDSGLGDSDMQGQQQFGGTQGQQGYGQSQGLGGQGQGQGFGSQDYGNTTDATVPGAGGSFGSTGRDAGRQGDLRDDGFSSSGAGAGAGQDDKFSGDQYAAGAGAGSNYDDDPNAPGYGQQGQQQQGKVSFGDKMKGSMEKMAGKVTGNQGLQERGQDRKMGEFDNNNSNNY